MTSANIAYNGDKILKPYGSGVHTIFNDSNRNVTQKNFNEDRRVKGILAVKEGVLASNFIDNQGSSVSAEAYVPQFVTIPKELKPYVDTNVVTSKYEGDKKQVSSFQNIQQNLQEYWNKPIIKIAVTLFLGLTGITLASGILNRVMAQKIGSKAKNFHDLHKILDTKISSNLEEVSVNLESIADKLIKTAHQDYGGNTKLYQELIDFSKMFKKAAIETKNGNLPKNVESMFDALKAHLNSSMTDEELAKLSPKLKDIALQYKNAQQLPPFARNININDDVHATLINAIQDPTNIKNLQAVIALFGVVTIGEIGRRFIDGLSEIWVRQREADIERDLQEAMIAIETRAFSGKNHILRNMLAQYASTLKNGAESLIKNDSKTSPYPECINLNNVISPHNNYTAESIAVHFAQKEKLHTVPISFGAGDVFGHFKKLEKTNNHEDIKEWNRKETAKKDKTLLYTLFALGTVATAGALYFFLHNLGNTAKLCDKLKSEITRKTRLMTGDYANITNKDTPFALQDPVFGNPTKVGLASYVEGVTGFLYTYIMNKTPETLLAFTAIAATTITGYIGAKFLDAIKTIQVKRVNAETERQLQERLVEVELKNFMAKKNSLIRPLITEYYEMLQTKQPTEKLNKQYNLILEEIKNGPPFVYS